ncbi:hypothetical protein Ga0074812_115158 [Parafrankia irregularis]|uniref:Uncharacterized protein n=1 Tax=Parafrankia irregularis TaxID=795642 RepID=A0A0S4QRK2_9ACTN|nr:MULTISPECIES: hypothetical protein [Parafrankia]MBE3202766.1 hypothetical protein [Parafrankia sp. CH37]CUU57956.1 hypothetical protein Ga0074812_115158 [Parafrankia irregularis]
MTRCEATARHGALWARLVLVSAVLLGLLAMHAGLAAQVHALGSPLCAEGTGRDVHQHCFHPHQPGGGDHGHQGTLCSAVLRDDTEPVARHGERYDLAIMRATADASSFLGTRRTRGDPPPTPPPRYLTDLSVYCVWRL